MESIENTLSYHKGRKIERIRKLRGFTQSDLGDKLGISKQAISKLEQSEKINDEKLKEVAEALEVTFEGLRDFSEEKVLYNTINFYENCGVTATNISSNVETINNPIYGKIVSFEEEIKAVRQEFIEMFNNKFK